MNAYQMISSFTVIVLLVWISLFGQSAVGQQVPFRQPQQTGNWLSQDGVQDAAAQVARTQPRAAAPSRNIVKTPDFLVPFEMADQSGNVAEVQLYMSEDRGANWQLYQKQAPSADGFQFRAPADGEYWFAVRTVHRGQTDAPPLQRATPEVKVVVDTKPPKLDVRVNVDPSGLATAEWMVQDPYLDASTFRLEYQDPQGRWQPVRVATPDKSDLRSQWQGKTNWRVSGPTGLSSQTRETQVRVSVMDRAENSKLVTKVVGVGAGDAANRTLGSTAGATNTSVVGRSFQDLTNGIRKRLPFFQDVRHADSSYRVANGNTWAGEEPREPNTFSPAGSNAPRATFANSATKQNLPRPANPQLAIQPHIGNSSPRRNLPSNSSLPPNSNQPLVVKPRPFNNGAEYGAAANALGQRPFRNEPGFQNQQQAPVPPRRHPDFNSAPHPTADAAPQPAPVRSYPIGRGDQRPADAWGSNEPSTRSPQFTNQQSLPPQPQRNQFANRDASYRDASYRDPSFRDPDPRATSLDNRYPEKSFSDRFDTTDSRAHANDGLPSRSAARGGFEDRFDPNRAQDPNRNLAGNQPFDRSPASQAGDRRQDFDRRDSDNQRNFDNRNFGSTRDFASKDFASKDFASNQNTRSNSSYNYDPNRNFQSADTRYAGQTTSRNSTSDQDRQRYDSGNVASRYPNNSARQGGANSGSYDNRELSRGYVDGPVAGQQQYDRSRSEPNDRAGEPMFHPHITASPNFELVYDLYGVGQRPSAVELWYTADRGRTWSRYGSDRDQQSPMEVQLRQQGLYGFQLIVDGGRGNPPAVPQNGDRPDVWVIVDWTKPQAQVTRVEPVGANGSDLGIEWKAQDVLLAEAPITLSYSDSPQGPWTTIVRDVPNSGAYQWRVNRRLPERLYVQIQARDMAGNVKTDVFSPAGGGVADIIGVQPVSTARSR